MRLTRDTLHLLPERHRAQAAAQLDGTHAAAPVFSPISPRPSTKSTSSTKSIRTPRSRTEALFARWFLTANPDITLFYEGLTFRLKGGTRYTPDWAFIAHGTLHVIEVKGTFKLGSHGAALVRFREARATYGDAIRFRWFTKQGNTFTEKYNDKRS